MKSNYYIEANIITKDNVKLVEREFIDGTDPLTAQHEMLEKYGRLYPDAKSINTYFGWQKPDSAAVLD